MALAVAPDRLAEVAAARRLTRRGAQVRAGAPDQRTTHLRACFPHQTWYVRVQTGLDGPPAMPDPGDLGRLKSAATRARAVPVVALVTLAGTDATVRFIAAATGQELHP